MSRLEALYSTSALIHQIYIYGNSERSFLLAVVVPTEDGVDASRIAESLREIARESQLNGYEIPRDFLIETEPFSLANGLLSGVGKFLRPKLKARYGDRLEQLYATIADDQLGQLRALRTGGVRSARARDGSQGRASHPGRTGRRCVAGGAIHRSGRGFAFRADVFHAARRHLRRRGSRGRGGRPDRGSTRVSPTTSNVFAAQSSQAPHYASVHDASSSEVHAKDLTLDKFIDADVLKAAMSLPAPTGDVRTVLLTGATGFLGRFLAMEWLQRLADSGGTLVCLTRGADAAQARQRIEAALDSDAGTARPVPDAGRWAPRGPGRRHR